MRTNEDEHFDVVVVGAGPAGLRAAVEADRVGCSVLVVDENAGLGGQIHRQPQGIPRRLALSGPSRAAKSLFDDARRSSVRFLHGAAAWGAFEPGKLEVVAEGSARAFGFKALVVATGAHDRPFPVPGWTLPGVFTAGGAQALLKSQGVAPGRKVLLAGTGPLQLVVASQLARAGVDVVAVVEAVPWHAALRRAADLARGGSTIWDGLRYRWNVARARVPWIAPAILVSIGGTERVETATIASMSPSWRPVPGTERTLEADAICLGYGLVPGTELLRALGCPLRYDVASAAWVPERDEFGETPITGVFAIGDGALVSGAPVAELEGRLAGRVIAERLRPGSVPASGPNDRLRHVLRRRRRFASAVREVYAVPPTLFARPDGETIVCRCEEVPAHRVRIAVLGGAASLGEIKVRTRLGMGPCQGKMCASTAAAMLASHLGMGPDQVAGLSTREPIRPVSIRALLGPQGPDVRRSDCDSTSSDSERRS